MFTDKHRRGWRAAFNTFLLLLVALTASACRERELSEDFATRKAVAYSGYRGPTRDTIPTDAQLLQDMQLLHQKGFGLIRTFGADPVIQRTLNILANNPQLNIKVQLGIWISGPHASHAAVNNAAMDEGIAVANNPRYRPNILAVSVGNETMIDWSGLRVPPVDMAMYIKYVRDRIGQPVTTDDNWAFFTGKNTSNTQTFETDRILKEIDFVSMHTYALLDTPWGLWDWKQTAIPEGPARAQAMMSAGATWTRSNFTSVRTYIDSLGYKDMQIVIGETGWKSFPAGGEVFRAHPVNQKMYYDFLNAWLAEPVQCNAPVQAASRGAYGDRRWGGGGWGGGWGGGGEPTPCTPLNRPFNIFYFEAFDEPWKGGDDGWGLWDVNRKEKFVLWSGETDGFDAATELALPAPPNDDAEYYAAPVTSAPVTAWRFMLYSESYDQWIDAQPNAGTLWNAWENNTTATIAQIDTDGCEGSLSQRITPHPLAWGWGMAQVLGESANLINFNTPAGFLNFCIKTTYAGKLEVGFFTGSGANGTAVDAYITMGAGDYGYENDGLWHSVTIPVPWIAAVAAPGYGMPATATLNMTQVYNGFVIADRYGVTGNAGGDTTPILVDHIYWSK